MQDIERLTTVFNAYCAATGLAAGTVSGRFLGRGRRFAEIQAGGDMGSRTIAKALEAFSRDWPEGAEWPADVPRPVVAQQEAA